MEVCHKSIRASHFVLSTLKPMQRIALDTIRPMDISKEFKYIIVIIDKFTRYVEHFPVYDVTATAVTDALWRHLPVRNAPRNRHRSGILIHEPDTPELRDTYRSAASWDDTIL